LIQGISALGAKGAKKRSPLLNILGGIFWVHSGAKLVGQSRICALLQENFHWLPAALVIADVFAQGANGHQAGQGLDLDERFFSVREAS